MQTPKLKAEQRTILGKKVKELRKKGILPTNLYGKKIKSQSLQVLFSDFRKIYDEVGETSLVNLVIGENKETQPILIHNIQLHPVTGEFLHADFYQVSLKEKVKAEIPLEIKGESPAVSQKRGMLIQPLSEVEVEALPADLPVKIEVDISKLAKVDQEIKVSDLKLNKKVAILTDKNLVVVKIGQLEEEKEEKPVEVPEEKPAEEEKEEKREEKQAPQKGREV